VISLSTAFQKFLPFLSKQPEPRFAFSQNSPLYSMMMQKSRSVMCCFKKKKTKGTQERERKKTGE
jgi:hypothetical protein